MGDKYIHGRDFGEGAIVLAGQITGNIRFIGRDVAEEPVAGGATLSDGTIAINGTTERKEAARDWGAGGIDGDPITIGATTGDLILVGRDFAAGCVASAGNTITGKAFQVGRSLAATVIAAAGGINLTVSQESLDLVLMEAIS